MEQHNTTQHNTTQNRTEHMYKDTKHTLEFRVGFKSSSLSIQRLFLFFSILFNPPFPLVERNWVLSTHETRGIEWKFIIALKMSLVLFSFGYYFVLYARRMGTAINL